MSAPTPVEANVQADQNSVIARLYHWGARSMGAILLIGVLVQVAGVLVGGDDGYAAGLERIWPHIALIGLWLVPVLCVTITGCVWVIKDRRHRTGWIAIGIGVFLSALWILK